MGMTRRRVGGAAAVSFATAANGYTVPASTKTVWKELTVNNTTAAPVTFSLCVGTGASTEMYSAYPLPANTTLTFWHQLPLCATENICFCAPVTTFFTLGLEENIL